MASHSSTTPPPPSSTTSSSHPLMASSSTTAAAAVPQGIANSSHDPASQTLSKTESDLLAEYARLLENFNKMSQSLHALAGTPTAEILDGLRMLERKTSLVFTLLKASVYSIVLQQEVYSGDHRAGSGAAASGSTVDGGMGEG